MNFYHLFVVASFLMTPLLLTAQMVEVDHHASQPRTAEQIKKEIEGLARGTGYREGLTKIIRGLSIDEMRAYFDGGPSLQSKQGQDQIIERWAFLDHRELLAWLHSEDQKVRSIMAKIRNHGPGTRVQAYQRRQEDTFRSFMRGWSRRDPLAAWNATKEPDGEVSYMFPLKNDRGYGHIILRNLIHNLAETDPRKAWDEYRDFPDRKYGWVFRESLLEGIAWALPDDTDWERALEQAIEYSGDDVERLKVVIQEKFLSRWLPHDFAAAQKWYRSEKADAISISDSGISFNSSTARFLFGSQVDPTMKVKMRTSMRPAIVRWIAQDFESALIWLRERKGFVQELFSKEKLRLWTSVALAPRKSREIMVVCLSREEREAILRECLGMDTNLISNPLEIFCSSGKKEEMRKSLAELEVSEDLVEEVIEKIRAGYMIFDDEE